MISATPGGDDGPFGIDLNDDDFRGGSGDGGTAEKAWLCRLARMEMVASPLPLQKKELELLEELSVVEAEVAGLEKQLLELLWGDQRHAWEEMRGDEAEQRWARGNNNRFLAKQQSLPPSLQQQRYDIHRDERSPAAAEATRTTPLALKILEEDGGADPSTCTRRRLQHSKSSILKTASASAAAASASNSRPRPCLRDHLSELPTSLSQKLVLCISSIYCKLSDPPPPPSPSSSLSSPIHCSLSLRSGGHDSDHRWSGGDAELWSSSHPFGDAAPHYRGGGAMVEVPWICVDKNRLSTVTRMLRDFRSMVEELEAMDPSRLCHDEKLAFWINIYNALLMHAHLAYGIPRNHVKRMTLLQRAAYKIGGCSINAYTIEHSLLRCRSHRPTQWLQNLLSSASKLKSRDERRSSFAIDSAEPLVCFALCCGGWSDPAVRVYSAENVHQELDAAKTDFLQATVGFQADYKVLLPKILEWYAREVHIPSNSLLDWVSRCLQDTDKHASLLDCLRSRPNRKPSHRIEWQPYNFSFRYLFHPHLTSRFTSYACCR